MVLIAANRGGSRKDQVIAARSQREPLRASQLWGAFGRNRRGRDLIRDCRTRSDLVGEIDADRFAARKYGADGYVGVRSGLRPTRDQHLIGL